MRDIKERFINMLKKGLGISFSRQMLKISQKTVKEWREDADFEAFYREIKERSRKRRFRG